MITYLIAFLNLNGLLHNGNRLVSGANIKIADLEDGNPDRHVSMTGTPEQIQLAQFLINARYVSTLR